MLLQQELIDRLDLSGKAKKKKTDAGKAGKEGKDGKKKGKRKTKVILGKVSLPCRVVDISAFDVDDMSGRYRLDMGMPAAVQVPPGQTCVPAVLQDACIISALAEHYTAQFPSGRTVLWCILPFHVRANFPANAMACRS